MNKEDKELLLKDLCSRLPYGVKVAIEYSKSKYTHIYDLKEIDNDATSELRQQVTVWNYGFYSSVISYPLIDCKPYLRPMSSMTEEERQEFSIFIGKTEVYVQKICLDTDSMINPIIGGFKCVYWGLFDRCIDWLIAHHFDYRGLIEKGLALEATKDNNPYV